MVCEKVQKCGSMVCEKVQSVGPLLDKGPTGPTWVHGLREGPKWVSYLTRVPHVGPVERVCLANYATMHA